MAYSPTKGFTNRKILFADIEDMSPVEIILPHPSPPKITKIRNYNRSETYQKWERILLPNSFHRFNGMTKEEIYKKLTKEENDYIKEQYYYLENGFWFFNNGELLWITGLNYFYLNWWHIPNPDGGGYPTFRMCDTEYFWHWWKVCNDPMSAGMIDMERRRSGKSFRAGAIAYSETFSHNDVLTGIQSKSDEDAIAFFTGKLIRPWKRLPFFFQPIFDTSNNPRDELRFIEPTKSGAAAREDISRQTGLSSFVEARPANEIAFDGMQLHRTIQDEAGKLTKKFSILKRWEVIKHCLQIDGRMIGKALVTSTVGEMNEGGGEFLELWQNSDPSKKIEGKTISWLEQHYIPAYDGYLIDEYGRTMKEQAQAKIKRDQFDPVSKKPYALAAAKRQFPRTLKEAFRSARTDCRFNIEIIDKRLEEFTFENKYLIYGNYHWKDNAQDTEVIFIPSDKRNGKFIVSYLFEDPAKSNQKFKKNGVWHPGNFNFGTAGADPYRYDEVSSSRKSMGAGAVFREYNPLVDENSKDISTWKTNRFICTYRNRPGRMEYGEDMLMMCVYYGVPMFPEVNIPFVMDYFTQRGYAGFLLHQKNLYERWSKAPGANTNEKIKSMLFDEMDVYIDSHGSREVHAEILEACREVDYNDLSPSDLFVSAGYALLGAKSKKSYYHAEKQEITQPLFKTYEM